MAVGGRPFRPEPETSTTGSRPRKSVPARSWPPAGHPVPHSGNTQRPLTTVWFRDVHRAWPARDDTDPKGGHGATHATCARRRSPPPRPGSLDRPRPRPGSLAPAPTPPTGRHPCRYGHTGRGNGDPKTAWPQPIAALQSSHFHRRRRQRLIVRLRQAVARRGSWTGRSRSCPHAYPLRPRDQSRGPSLPARYAARRSAVLRPRRTPAALHWTSPSAYTTWSLPDKARQTGLSCSEPDLCTCRPPYPGGTRPG